MVRMCRGIPVVVWPENGTFHPNMSAIERAVTPATKAIICNSPNNPSGVMFDESLIADLVGFCEGKGVYLVMDDIYHKLVFDGRSAVSPYRFTSKDLEASTLIVVNGVSKLYGMTGFRIGWTIAPRPLVEVMTNVQAQTTTCASPVMQAGAEGALNGPQSAAETLRVAIQHNRDVMMRELASFAGVTCQVPDGAFYCLPNFEAYRKDSVGLAEFLVEKARVVTVPGREFGMDGHLRLSFSGSAEDVTEGVARIKWALDPNAPREIRIGDRTCARDWD
jgi:aspartate aminotransferase